MSFFRRFSSALILCVAAFSLAGCMPKDDKVNLLYAPDGNAAIPAHTAPRVVVAQFEDQRGRTDIGVRRDGTPLKAASDVSQWVSQSLADALARAGMQVSVAPDLQHAQVGRPDAIVTGVVERAWLEEQSLSTCQASIRIQTSLHRDYRPDMTRNFSSQQERKGIPGMKLIEDTLASTLEDAVFNAAEAITAELR